MIKDFYNKLRNAFTLSEVMLTMTVIGVLATLTISTVGASIQQRARLAEFRTAYAKMDAALRNIITDEGRIYACYLKPSEDDKTTFDLKIEGTVVDTGSGTTECTELMQKFINSMGLTRACKTNPRSEGCIEAKYPKGPEDGGFQDYTTNYAYVLDNSMLVFDNNKEGLLLFAIDVNGRKGPNKWGQDIFPFSLKVTESKLVNGNTFVKEVAFLPANVQTSYDSPVDKTTKEMMKESAGRK